MAMMESVIMINCLSRFKKRGISVPLSAHTGLLFRHTLFMRQLLTPDWKIGPGGQSKLPASAPVNCCIDNGNSDVWDKIRH
jgi:hypothetical protein